MKLEEITLGFKKVASGDATAYKAYFNKKMEEKGIKDPSDLGSAKAKKKFFKEVDEGYQSDNEKTAMEKEALKLKTLMKAMDNAGKKMSLRQLRKIPENIQEKGLGKKVDLALAMAQKNQPYRSKIPKGAEQLMERAGEARFTSLGKDTRKTQLGLIDAVQRARGRR